MEWWGWVVVTWILASILATIGMCRWFKFLRGDFD
jgi:hypothetical protein